MKKLRIYQITEGYCYNSDTLFLWDFLRPYLRANAKVLDIGSGSGILGLLCARDCNIKLFGIERQREYVLLSVKNALSNDISACFLAGSCELFLDKTSIESFCIDYNTERTKLYSLKGSLATQSLWQSFDMVVSNPPFYDSSLHSQNRLKAEARQSSFLPLENLLESTRKILKPNGKMFFCYPSSNLATLMLLLMQYGLSVDSVRFVYPRLDKEATLALIYAKKNSNSKKCNTQIHVLPPLITHIGHNQKDNSQEVQNIYSRASTCSIKVNWSDIIWEKLLD